MQAANATYAKYSDSFEKNYYLNWTSFESLFRLSTLNRYLRQTAGGRNTFPM